MEQSKHKPNHPRTKLTPQIHINDFTWPNSTIWLSFSYYLSRPLAAEAEMELKLTSDNR